MEQTKYYTSGEFARMARVSVRTIRFYDKQNILRPSYVNDYGKRFYTDSDLARLQQILLLKYLGFSLDDIRNMTINDSDTHMLINSLNLQLKLIRDRIEQLQMVEKGDTGYDFCDRDGSLHRLEPDAGTDSSDQHGKKA